MIRVGLGRDIHRLAAGRPLLLGGVCIPSEKGEDGHSDGDALIHAIIDALLGAAGLCDIGELFPDTAAAYKDADSAVLLQEAARLIRRRGYEIVNIDAVVCLETPRIAPYKAAIKERLAAVLEIPADRIGVKGKTGEGIGEIGEGRAVETFAVVLLETGGATEARSVPCRM